MIHGTQFLDFEVVATSTTLLNLIASRCFLSRDPSNLQTYLLTRAHEVDYGIQYFHEEEEGEDFAKLAGIPAS